MANARRDGYCTSERDQNHVLGSLGNDVVEWLLEWCSLIVNYNRHKSKYTTDEALFFILLCHEWNDADEEDSSQHLTALGILIAAAIVGKQKAKSSHVLVKGRVITGDRVQLRTDAVNQICPH